MAGLPQALFSSPLPGLDRPLTHPEGQLLAKYLELLRKWQKVHRLVGSTTQAWMVENIVLDSCAFLGLVPTGIRRIADVGSGAGIPGVPIAIVRPELEMSLIEPRRRRVSFLSTVVRELELAHVQVVAARVEEMTETHRGAFDAVVMRCAGTVSTMLSPVLAIVRRGGLVVATAKRGSPGGRGGEAVTVPMADGRGREFRLFRNQ